jgi:hypothetical protein
MIDFADLELRTLAAIQAGLMCPYCGSSTKLVTGATIYPHRPDLDDKMFYMCDSFSHSLAYVGCHKDTTDSLGSLADEELRQARSKAHKVFDPLWREGGMSRKQAYKELATYLNIPGSACHIGMFNLEQCVKTLDFGGLE